MDAVAAHLVSSEAGVPVDVDFDLVEANVEHRRDQRFGIVFEIVEIFALANDFGDAVSPVEFGDTEEVVGGAVGAYVDPIAMSPHGRTDLARGSKFEVVNSSPTAQLLALGSGSIVPGTPLRQISSTWSMPQTNPRSDSSLVRPE